MKSNFLVLQTDFGLVDGAVSAMIGVALNEAPDLTIHSLTHDITPYDIFEASYRLIQTVPYWPAGTVFVSVVDPGVGSARKSVVAKTKDGYYIVTPDNGTLTHLAENFGIVEMREISENEHRRKDTEASYTFHGRDVYAFTGAKLASGHISFEEVGPMIPVEEVVLIETVPVTVNETSVTGTIDILDVRFGSLWTSIPREAFLSVGFAFNDTVKVSIFNSGQLVYSNEVTYGRSFADVHVGNPIIYVNSLYRMGLAINQGSFAKAYNVSTGHQWVIRFEKKAS